MHPNPASPDLAGPRIEEPASHPALLTSTTEGACDYIDADLREPGKILEQAAKTLDFTQPVAIMMLGILNFIVDTDEAEFGAVVDVMQRIRPQVPKSSAA